MKPVLRAFGAAFLPVLDVILPERQRAARVRKKKLADFALSPTEHSLLGEKIITLLDYKDPGVSDLVRALKYEHSAKAAALCAEMLADYLREEAASLHAFSARPIKVIPMPLHASRIRERGFNQIERILAQLPEEFKDGSLSRLEKGALMRLRETPQQARLPRAERLKNVAGAFAADAAKIADSHCILIDDVTTTGATLASAGRALREAGTKVTLLALARA